MTAAIYESAWALETARQYGLPELHAFHPAAFMLRWLEERGHSSSMFTTESAAARLLTEQHSVSYPEFFRDHWDGRLTMEMVKDSALPFVTAYMEGPFLDDYEQLLAPPDSSFLHVAFTEENFQKLQRLLDERRSQFAENASVFSTKVTAAIRVAACIVIASALVVVFAFLTGLFSLIRKDWALAGCTLGPVLLLFLWFRHVGATRKSRLRELARRFATP